MAAAAAAEDAQPEVNWNDWRKCPICRAETDWACYALSGRVAGCRPDGAITMLIRPHSGRRRRAGRSGYRPAPDRRGEQRCRCGAFAVLPHCHLGDPLD